MWQLADNFFTSRFLIGTAQYPTLQILLDAIKTSQAEILTVSLKRQQSSSHSENHFWQAIKTLNLQILPNTAGCHHADEAILMAHMAKEIFQTHWIKLEVIGDDFTLQPDPFELVKAAKQLVQQGFEVFPYCTDDLILCQRLIDVGCRILMPWAAPIGSGKGILNPFNLETLRHRLPSITLIIDAGIGKPSHAAQAMEFGVDGILLNSAVALANDPVKMAYAFQQAITAGRAAYEAGMMLERNKAHASTLLIDTPFWRQENIS